MRADIKHVVDVLVASCPDLLAPANNTTHNYSVLKARRSGRFCDVITMSEGRGLAQPGHGLDFLEPKRCLPSDVLQPHSCAISIRTVSRLIEKDMALTMATWICQLQSCLYWCAVRQHIR